MAVKVRCEGKSVSFLSFSCDVLGCSRAEHLAIRDKNIFFRFVIVLRVEVS